MILKETEDTIVAIATPVGEGAISIVRLSGPEAIGIVGKSFESNIPIALQLTHTVHFGKIFDKGKNLVDEVFCLVFRAPKSYTGEDIVEINCHGGLLVTRKILEVMVEAGARLALPGEFTKRAFLNGKMDLSQAEAVADLIKAQSERAHKASIEQLEGKISKDISIIRKQLIESLGLLELELDFVEENIELVDKKNVRMIIEKTLMSCGKLIESYKEGRVLHEGVKVTLLGVPNVGKSSLLNALLNQDRAIVTHIPGTTRDFIEEKIVIDGILFRITDTAGARKASDPIEQEGVRRTIEIAKKADILLVVLDSSESTLGTDVGYLMEIVQKRSRDSKIIIVENKIDLLKVDKRAIHLKELHSAQSIKTSAITLEGIKDLKNALVSKYSSLLGISSSDTAVITSQRHQESLLRAKNGLENALQSLKKRVSNEFIAVDLRAALDALGEIIGEVTTEEILNDIFSKFCVGK